MTPEEMAYNVFYGSISCHTHERFDSDDAADCIKAIAQQIAEAMRAAAREERYRALTEAIHAMEEPGITDWGGCISRVDYLRKNALRALP